MGTDFRNRAIGSGRTMTFRKTFIPRAWRLTPRPDSRTEGLALAQVQGPTGRAAVILPHLAKLRYVVVRRGAASLSIDAGPNFVIEKLSPFAAAVAWTRLAFIRKRKKYLCFPDFFLFSVGHKHRRRRFTHFNQHMLGLGVAVDGPLFGTHPELLAGWPQIPGPARRIDRPVRAAVVVHIYYEDTWRDFAAVLKRVPIPFDLIVTTVPAREGLAAAVREEFPWAEVIAMDNRGRDVRPFLALLEEGRLDRYAFVCKLHGKKSSDGGRSTHLGALWRRRLLLDLLAAPGIAESIVATFDNNPAIGMIGPRVFRMPSATHPEALAWGAGNRETILALAERMGTPADRYLLDFFGGTMFWVRPEALKPLRRLNLAESFSEERGFLDGGLEHAVERLFAAAVVQAGYQLADIDAMGVLPERPDL